MEAMLMIRPQPLFEHAVDEWPGHVENGVEIDAQDRIPIGVAQLAERSIARDARVVDQDVDVVTVCCE
jgi:hypothetical protein